MLDVVQNTSGEISGRPGQYIAKLFIRSFFFISQYQYNINKVTMLVEFKDLHEPIIPK